MAEHPYLLVLEGTAAANSKSTLSYQVPQNIELSLHRFVFQSTGLFNVTDIRDSRGIHYTNASEAQEIVGTFFRQAGVSYRAIDDFIVPLVLPGGTTLYIDVEDASGSSNTVTLVVACVRKT